MVTELSNNDVVSFLADFFRYGDTVFGYKAENPANEKDITQHDSDELSDCYRSDTYHQKSISYYAK